MLQPRHSRVSAVAALPHVLGESEPSPSRANPYPFGDAQLERHQNKTNQSSHQHVRRSLELVAQSRSITSPKLPTRLLLTCVSVQSSSLITHHYHPISYLALVASKLNVTSHEWLTFMLSSPTKIDNPRAHLSTTTKPPHTTKSNERINCGHLDIKHYIIGIFATIRCFNSSIISDSKWISVNTQRQRQYQVISHPQVIQAILQWQVCAESFSVD
ncbi:Hypothetical protein MVR_LOCUS3 [uncultured virus]|nr:Hypothetical protein MVR_LOCUS3 [uncultured virus]